MTSLRSILTKGFAAVALLLTVSACSDNDSFKVEGTVENLGTQNLRIVYSDGHALRSVISTAVDSKFNFSGNAPEETVVEVYSNARSLIGRFAARNGEELNITLKHDNPLYLKAKGNATSVALGAFLEKNADADDLNEVIARQVAEHPDDPLSVILLTFYYNPSVDPVATDSLIRLLDADKVKLPDIAYGLMALTRRANALCDTIPELELVTPDNFARSFAPAEKGRTLYMFMDLFDLPDSAISRLKRADFESIGYIHMNNDTMGWARFHEQLPKQAAGFLAPAGIAEPALRNTVLEQVPLFVVTDSVGAVQARATDILDLL